MNCSSLVNKITVDSDIQPNLIKRSIILDTFLIYAIILNGGKGNAKFGQSACKTRPLWTEHGISIPKRRHQHERRPASGFNEAETDSDENGRSANLEQPSTWSLEFGYGW